MRKMKLGSHIPYMFFEIAEGASMEERDTKCES